MAATDIRAFFVAASELRRSELAPAAAGPLQPAHKSVEDDVTWAPHVLGSSAIFERETGAQRGARFRQRCARAALLAARSQSVFWEGPRLGHHVATAMQFDSVGSLLAVGRSDGGVLVFDCDELRCGELSRTARPLLSPVCHVKFPARVSGVRWNPSDESQLLVCSGRAPQAGLYDLARCTLLRKFDAPAGVADCQPLISRHLVLGGDRGGSLLLWDERVGGRPQRQLKGAGAVRAVTSSEDSQVLATFREDGRVELWDARFSPTCVREMTLWDTAKSKAATLSAVAVDPREPLLVGFQTTDCVAGCADLRSRCRAVATRAVAALGADAVTGQVFPTLSRPARALVFARRTHELLLADTEPLATGEATEARVMGGAATPLLFAEPLLGVCVHPDLPALVCATAADRLVYVTPAPREEGAT
jgi:hypothetical protein